ncbi:MAG TPA: nucleotide exchange factor GrpE [Thermoanaerobaculaceae bacterium]|nr:nucleotide exchange factor GrpE [Thermoanaerobaculaceae bacterium]
MTEEERRLAPEQPAEGRPKGEGEAHAGAEESAAVGDEAFQEEMANLQQEIARFKELYLRKLADFDNYRKRQEREMGEFRRFAKAELMRDCLPVLDNLERALAVPGGDGSGLREGVELVLRQFKDVLARHGLNEVDPIDQPFDPTQHEAISRNEVQGVLEPTVVQVLQKGYMLGERLIRPALVIVAVPVAGTAEGGEAADSEGDNGQDHRN